MNNITKAKIFKYKRGKVQTFEVAWFTSYNKPNQELHTENFKTLKEAKDFYYKLLASKKQVLLSPLTKDELIKYRNKMFLS